MAPDGTTIILGIESSCDETAAAVLVDGVLRSNVIAGQDVHRIWGGVVPELASRAHQEHIVPVVDEALRQAGVEREQLSGIAFTQGPGLIGALLGSLLVFGFAVRGIAFQLSGVSGSNVLRPFVTPGFTLGAVLVALLGAVGAALWPAFRASRLNPVEALRS